ncbi:MAG: DUF192 domain-containing protein [Candidatus Altiarchaeota archaeon]
MRARLLVPILLILCLLYISRSIDESDSVCFKDSCVKVEIADNESGRMKGLMFRETLPPDRGMLFIFEEEGIHSFWMKNTLIPLDIIWLDSNMRVVNIEHAAPCKADPCQSYNPGETAKYVLEVNGGYATEHGIKVGDTARR